MVKQEKPEISQPFTVYAKIGQRNFWRSIRVRLTLFYVVAILLLLIGAGFILYWEAERIVLRETDEALVTRAGRIVEAHDFHQSLMDLQLKDADFQVGDIGVDHFYYGFYDNSNGNAVRVASTAPHASGIGDVLITAAQTQKPGTFSYYGSPGFRWRILDYHLTGSPNILIVATPWDPNEYRLGRLILTLVELFGVVLLVSGVGSYVLIGRTLRPIDEIVTEAETISADRMAERLLPEHAASDTEIGHLVSALNDMFSRLNRVFNGQRQFIADASHEMRTPLTVLRGEMELALSRDRSIDDYKSVLRSGLDETKRLAGLVESLGLLARGDASGWRIEGSQVFDCNRLLLGLTASMQHAANAANITLAYYPCNAIAEVSGDEGSLRRAFSNLIENGLHYTPQGGRVDVTTRINGNILEVVVADTGVGISEEDKQRIFDRFYRSTRTRTMSEGSGLGLAITLHTIKSHGGEIQVRSSLKSGSEFTVKIPLVKSTVSELGS
jgi:signal transduction histidine kinase